MTISGCGLRGASGNTAIPVIPQTTPKRRYGDAETASLDQRENGIPYGIRTRVTRMRTWCPRPLDERDSFFIKWHSQGDSNPCYQDENLVS